MPVSVISCLGRAGFIFEFLPPVPHVDAQVVAALHIRRSPDVADALVALGDLTIANLSTREFDIFRMLAEGRGYAEIAQTLSPSQKSGCKLCDPVTHYAIRVKQKLGARSLADLIQRDHDGDSQEERAFPGCDAET